MARPKVLIIENDDVTRTQLEWAFKDEFALLPAGDGTTALTVARVEHPALVLLDLGLPPHPNDPEGGLRWLQDFRKDGGTGKVIVCTGYGDRQYAVRAVGYGAYDFLTKPVDLDLLRLIMQRACWIAELEQERRTLTPGIEAEEEESEALAAPSGAPLQAAGAPSEAPEAATRTEEGAPEAPPEAEGEDTAASSGAPSVAPEEAAVASDAAEGPASEEETPAAAAEGEDEEDVSLESILEDLRRREGRAE